MKWTTVYHHLIKWGSKLLVNWHKQERQIIDFRRGLLLLSGLFGVHVMTWFLRKKQVTSFVQVIFREIYWQSRETVRLASKALQVITLDIFAKNGGEAIMLRSWDCCNNWLCTVAEVENIFFEKRIIKWGSKSKRPIQHSNVLQKAQLQTWRPTVKVSRT